MDFTELTWGIAGLAAGLGLAMLAMWLLLALDAGRLRRLMRRQRARLAMSALDDGDAAPPVPATEPLPAPEPKAPEPIAEVTTLPEPASEQAAEKPGTPVSVENLFAEAFEAGAPTPMEVEPPAGEWRPAKPRSQQPPE